MRRCRDARTSRADNDSMWDPHSPGCGISQHPQELLAPLTTAGPSAGDRVTSIRNPFHLRHFYTVDT